MTNGSAVAISGAQRARKDSRLTVNLRKRGYYLCSEVAQKLGVHKTTLYRWIRDGRIEALDFNGAYYVEWDSLVKHLGEVASVLGLTGETDNAATKSSTSKKGKSWL